MRRLLPALLLLAASALACSDDDAGRGEDGRITEPGPVNVFDLEVGDCLNPDEGTEGEVTEIEAVPCSEPHTQEVFALPEYEAPEGQSDDLYPGEGEIRKFADAACLDAFERYTGADYLDSDLFFSYLHPSLDSWNEGDDRTVVCVIVATGEPTTGSVRAGEDEGDDEDDEDA